MTSFSEKHRLKAVLTPVHRHLEEEEMEGEVTRNIDELIARMYCSKNFKCAKSGFERLCKAKYIGLERFLECLETDPADCSFVMRVGDQYYCDCPLRVYLERKLNK